MSRELYLHRGRGNKCHQLGTGLFVHHRTLLRVKRVEFLSDRMSYTVLVRRWCGISLRNVCVRALAKFRERLLASSCLPVCLFFRPSAQNNSAPTERIFMKSDFFLNFVEII
jgi:hypothetical protein